MCCPSGASFAVSKPPKNQPSVELEIINANSPALGIKPCFFLSYVYVKDACVSTALFRRLFLNKGRFLIGPDIKFAEIVEHVMRGGRLLPPAGAAWCGLWV